MAFTFGITSRINSIPGFANAASTAAMGALQGEAEDILTAALHITPVDTGALRNSGRAEVEHIAPRVVATIGFGGPAIGYALIVHEDLAARHASPTQAKFLEVPLLQAKKGFSRRIAQRMKDLLKEHAPEVL